MDGSRVGRFSMNAMFGEYNWLIILIEKRDEYMNKIDFSSIKRLFLKKGKSINFKKKNYFVRQKELCKFINRIKK